MDAVKDKVYAVLKVRDFFYDEKTKKELLNPIVDIFDTYEGALEIVKEIISKDNFHNTKIKDSKNGMWYINGCYVYIRECDVLTNEPKLNKIIGGIKNGE